MSVQNVTVRAALMQIVAQLNELTRAVNLLDTDYQKIEDRVTKLEQAK
jgi:prefoldin subunit 5